MNEDSTAQPSTAAEPPPKELSGRMVVLGIFAFSIVAVAILWVYSVMHAAPFLDLTRAIGEQFPGSRPKVTGGQRKMHQGTPRILRVVVRGQFTPATTEAAASWRELPIDEQEVRLRERAARFAIQVREFVVDNYTALAEYQRLEVHVYWPEPEQHIHKWPFEWSLDELTGKAFETMELADFVPFSPQEGAVASWSETDGVIRTTGQPRGYLVSLEEFEDFTLRLEYRLEPPAADEELPQLNSGVLLFIVGENRLWPVCVEVQGKHIEMAQIKSNARDLVVDAETDQPARDAARKSPGEWNTLEIVARQGALTVQLNSTEVSRSQPGIRSGQALTRGRLGLQAEGWPVEFRHVQLRRD